MTKIGDVFSGGDKIGELYTGGGGFCALLIVALILAPIVAVVAGVVTVVQNLQHAADAQATATAQVPILAQSNYYSVRAQVIDVHAPVNPHSRTFPDGTIQFLFHIIFTNTDSVPHDVSIHYSFTVNEYVSMYSEFESRNVDESADYTLQAHGNTDETITFEGDYNGPISGFRAFSLRLLTVDGEPAKDPRVALSHLSYGVRAAARDQGDNATGFFGVECRVTIDNSDTAPHYVDMGADWSFTYIDDAGNTQSGSDSQNPQHYTGDLGMLVPAKGSNNIVLYLDAGPGYAWGNHGMLTLHVQDLTVTMADPGDENVPPQILSKTITSAGCNYK